MLMDLTRLQEVTLADLYHLPYGKWVFVDLGLGDLDKRPNLKRCVISSMAASDF
jgi:hypothetical protein